jgi:rhodanese-related sulfurtransferase
LITSTLIGLAANYFNPNGISLIRTTKDISWATDSLFNISQLDSVKDIPINESPNDAGTYEKTKIENNIRNNKKNNPPEKSLIKEEQTKKVEEEKTNEPEVVTFENPKNITLEQAFSLFNNGVTFIDARDEADYLAGYISGSINIPYYDFENHKHKLQKLSKDIPLVIYCAGTDCDLSILLANQLSKLEYKQIYIFFGGWLEWYKANYPTENPSEE